MAWTFYNAQGHALAAPISVATDAIWVAAGDLTQGTGPNAGARLALGATGTVVRSTGTANAYALPPGHEWDYAQISTATVNVTALSEGVADTVITGNAVTFDGAPVLVEFFTPDGDTPFDAVGRALTIWLYDGAASIGSLITRVGPTTTANRSSMYAAKRFTPTAAVHTYSVRASVSAGTGQLRSGPGGIGAQTPSFMRITKV